MVSVTGAGYWSGTGDQPLPGARAATTASARSAACLADASCVQMTWAPAHAVKCSLYTSIQPGKQEHNPQCTASAVKCAKGATDPTTCAAFGTNLSGAPSAPSVQRSGWRKIGRQSSSTALEGSEENGAQVRIPKAPCAASGAATKTKEGHNATLPALSPLARL